MKKKENKFCSLAGCNKRHYATGLCRAHYDRKIKGRDLFAPFKGNNAKICTASGCTRPTAAKNLCGGHYQRLRAGKPIDGPLREHDSTKLCSVDGCTRKHAGRGYCAVHYSNYRKYGKAEPKKNKRTKCIVKECGKNIYLKELCRFHYNRKVRGKTLDAPAAQYAAKTGERYIDAHGYMKVKTPAGWQLEHRKVMSDHLGRPLESHESVHHINGFRYDNRLENLELWTKDHPSGQRLADKIKWAREFLQKHEKEENLLQF